ncbi:MAG TPA: adenosylcobinamide-phosphate synthase CbiB [Alphaproteobacteria bacterium]|nr:adenosylcobinamide-phosphate synthase CbiB [Alphaproteobacteria bacterium]
MTAFDPLDFRVLAFALVLEALIGYPDGLYSRLRHPVVWLGALIDGLDRLLNRPTLGEGARRGLGALGLAVLLTVAGGAATAIVLLCRAIPYGWLIEAVLAASLLAQRSLASHVAAVADAFGAGGLEAARRAVSAIVGRDPESLDEAGVCRAAIESLAENFSDGVVAPALWLALGGFPGIVLYKAINTADSMIGHMSPRHRAYGWAAARLDDLVNLPASRLAAVLIMLAASLTPAARAAEAWRAVRRDARRHRSPNAGFPEAAMAGALGLRLAGPRIYGGAAVADAWMGDGRAAATPADIRAALRLYRAACGALWLLALAGLALSLG